MTNRRRPINPDPSSLRAGAPWESPPPADPTDPLGRLAAHASRPYAAPAATETDLIRHWRDVTECEAMALSDSDLAAALADALAVVEALAARQQAINAESRAMFDRTSAGERYDFDVARELDREATQLTPRLARHRGRLAGYQREADRRLREPVSDPSPETPKQVADRLFMQAFGRKP